MALGGWHQALFHCVDDTCAEALLTPPLIAPSGALMAQVLAAASGSRIGWGVLLGDYDTS